ncbi:MAG TPA: competence protein ComA [Chloroflexi bacterium]|nr:competence protein ComA [Chloroflexota bacterium]HHW86616.1 PaaI family thioesterase [Chloroflexota bacterium]
MNFSEAAVLEQLRQRSQRGLPAHMQLKPVRAAPGALTLQLEIQPFHLAPNGYLHAATIVALADTACGFGCIVNLPPGAVNFTTLELKSNFLRTATHGVIECTATLQHGGKRTQVWDATVYDAERRAMALFRCTQMLLYA